MTERVVEKLASLSSRAERGICFSANTEGKPDSPRTIRSERQRSSGKPRPRNDKVKYFWARFKAKAGARLLLTIGLLLAVAAVPLVIFPANAQQSVETDRAKQVGTKLKCMCGGCADSAGTCYHTGGAFSGPCDTAKAELKQIKQHLDAGESEDLIVQAFVQQYGPQVYVEPPHQGIGNLAWWMPAAALVIGLALVIFIISRWSKRSSLQAAGAAAGAGTANANVGNISPELLARAREQAARETDD